MSRTLKDRPWRLGGDRHKWVIVADHGAHGKFTDRDAPRPPTRGEATVGGRRGEHAAQEQVALHVLRLMGIYQRN